MNIAGTFQAVGIFLLACAAGGYVYKEQRLPPPAPKVELSCPAQAAPVVNVAAPKPYICTPAQAEAGECLPLAPAQPAPARVERAPAPARVAPARKKPVASATAKLRKQWSKPDG